MSENEPRARLSVHLPYRPAGLIYVESRGLVYYAFAYPVFAVRWRVSGVMLAGGFCVLRRVALEMS